MPKPGYKDLIDELRRKGTLVQDFQAITRIKTARTRLKVIDTLAALLAVAGIIIQYFLADLLFYSTPRYTITSQYNNFCYLGIVFTVLLGNPYLVICLFGRFMVNNTILAIKKSNLESDAFQAQALSVFTLELIICSFTALPNVNYTFTGAMLGGTFIYHLTDVMLIIMLGRCFLILRLYEHYSKWTSFAASQLCKKYGTTNDAFFAMKSDLKDRPFLTIGVIMVMLIIIFGVATMTSEKSFTSTVFSLSPNMDQLSNEEWLIAITMATVGYGDYFPSTHFGRFFCILACISGMILISAMVVALNLASEFSKDQSIAYLAIRTKNREIEWFASAAEVIKAAFRCEASKKSMLRKYKLMLMLRKRVFNFKRKTQLNSLMDITSAEMLYDLQHKLEEKLLATKTIITEIPRLEERCVEMQRKQKDLDEKMEKITQQQKIIANYVDIA